MAEDNTSLSEHSLYSESLRVEIKVLAELKSILQALGENALLELFMLLAEFSIRGLE